MIDFSKQVLLRRQTSEKKLLTNYILENYKKNYLKLSQSRVENEFEFDFDECRAKKKVIKTRS